MSSRPSVWLSEEQIAAAKLIMTAIEERRIAVVPCRLTEQIEAGTLIAVGVILSDHPLEGQEEDGEWLAPMFIITPVAISKIISPVSEKTGQITRDGSITRGMAAIDPTNLEVNGFPFDFTEPGVIDQMIAEILENRPADE